MLTGQILLQIIAVLLISQLFSYICHLLGQQWVIGEILAGLALGPSLLGWLFPGLELYLFPADTLPTLQTLGDIGLILYMFSLGMKFDINMLLQQSKRAFIVSLSGILLPFILGAILSCFLYPGLAGPNASFVSFALLIGTAMAITAFPVLARMLTERNMLETRIGSLVLTSASVDDVAAWCLLALVVATVHVQGLFSEMLLIGKVILFLTTMLFVVRPLFKYVMKYISSQHMQIVLSIVILLLSAFITNTIGIHPIFGAFIAGVIMPRQVALTGQFHSIDKVNNCIFLPIYFVFSGLQTHLGLIHGQDLWLICLLIFAIACAGKLVGGTLSTRLMGDSWREAISVGILMNTRGLVELIVINIGLQLGVLSPTLFVMLVIMAVLTTMITSPLITLFNHEAVQPVQGSNDEALKTRLQL
jgi:Kef-type K+ transport system membrane component KefB